jgi:phage gp46-like protein
MDTYIDPLTRGYLVAGTDLQRDPGDGLANAIYLRIVTPIGTWWADPTVGSRLHELQRAKATSDVLQAAQLGARQALAPMIDDGRLASVDVDTEIRNMADASRAVALRVTAVAANGRVITFNHHVQVA